ncbi:MULTISPECIES: acetate/propionate family kinase [unclassified Ruegeria]|uniref:acetate/propionate family kinase n=1 Tax=unclassified Ruegeria TaxID=2625375 RepID=UPI0014877EA1|nr:MULTISPECIES: acetate/propionate family kinase [unclassified Ruegeria]NOD64407.1 acetate/propionate family kinase [Ruegeria sp. HKCCD6109]NOD76874.1 acetate/propionate family kinase [Ruegeria sp. HKCCD4332]NOD88397.1 acetate/propionate family kinase [Ruegeria sp. HKCCD4318]NOD94780.1 acetate/propionate family kinase [Ruegeria sp. HKCCD4884]NOE13306.1 acetate/propionate family kinase [Ruegeria sp. HKCCD4318-2]
MTHVVTLNAGSSSMKFGLFELTNDDPIMVCTGAVERIGEGDPLVKAKSSDGSVLATGTAGEIHDHAAALDWVLNLLARSFPNSEVTAFGHRVVHGGPNIDAPLPLTEAAIEALDKLSPFAPLHQPHNLAGAKAAMERFPDAVQIACFDTAFHRNHPWENDVFALPREYYDKGVRRYGFHGLSYEYISDHMAKTAPLLHEGRVVVAHLGNGASMCAMIGGRSVGSTMGFSALDGLPMGSRCGQLDPGVVLYLMDQEGLSADEISDLLFRKSGLLGLSGLSNDMRTLEKADTPESRQAISYFTFRIRRELGAMAAILGGIDALVFTGGIGENSRLVRDRVCSGMGWLGIELNPDANADNDLIISTDLSRVVVMAIPTNEELMIARAAADLLARRPHLKTA